jgi:hypothetical protein
MPLQHSGRRRALVARLPRRSPCLSAVTRACPSRSSATPISSPIRRTRSATPIPRAPPGRRTVNAEPLPGSLVTVTSPPIMRASLRDNARPNPVPRCQRIGLGEVLEQFRLPVRQLVPPPPLLCELSGQAHHDSDSPGAKSLVVFRRHVGVPCRCQKATLKSFSTLGQSKPQFHPRS